MSQEEVQRGNQHIHHANRIAREEMNWKNLAKHRFRPLQEPLAVNCRSESTLTPKGESLSEARISLDLVEPERQFSLTYGLQIIGFLWQIWDGPDVRKIISLPQISKRFDNQCDCAFTDECDWMLQTFSFFDWKWIENERKTRTIDGWSFRD
jgi:hypothetical protein